jgi:hypothetical protein
MRENPSKQAQQYIYFETKTQTTSEETQIPLSCLL